MNAPDDAAIRFHDDRRLFRAALDFTTAETGFNQRLIEKDYFCTIVLQYLCAADPSLVFKGGTCLAKVHAGFYRLSEDLDFTISMAPDATRRARSGAAAAFKAAITGIRDTLPVISIIDEVAGANNSKQYLATLRYGSVLSGNQETIKVEVGLRESILTEVLAGDAHTLLRDPVRSTPALNAVRLPCISRTEAMAEKLRAALSRRDVAIRDFYDIDHAVRNLGLNVLDPELLALTRKKLAVPDNPHPDMSDDRCAPLQRQLDAQLRPVLRPRDFEQFDLARSLDTLRRVADAIR